MVERAILISGDRDLWSNLAARASLWTYFMRVRKISGGAVPPLPDEIQKI